MEIGVIGAGYVGLTTAACLAELGHHVFCADSDREKLALLREGRMPFFEPHLEGLVQRNAAAGRLEFGATAAAIGRSRALFICVGTPPLDNGDADLSAIEAVAREIAEGARGYRLIVEKSTVPVQTAQRLRKHLAIYSRHGLDYDVVSNPEFLREGSAVEDFFHPDRIVVGTESARARELMEEIYRPVLAGSFACPVHVPCQAKSDVRFLATDTNSAELIKHASNSFLAMKISFINMVADLCEAAGADIERVVEGLGSDRRIGPAFLRPGVGFGGFCFPKDLQAFIRIAEKFACDFSLLREVERINLRRVEQFVDKVRNELWVLRGKKIAVWGLAFKPETDDLRFAPALAIVRRLLAEGARIQAYDPQALTKAQNEIPEIAGCENAYEAAAGADAILVLTEWEEFRTIDWARVAAHVDRRLVFDGRNLFVAADVVAHGFHYIGIGQIPVTPDAAVAPEREMVAAAFPVTG